MLVQGTQNAIPTVSSNDDYGSAGQKNVGQENIQLTPIQVNNIIG